MSNVPPPQPPVPPQGPVQPAGPLSPEQDKQFAMFAHFGGGAVALLGVLMSFAGVGFLGWLTALPALIIFLVYKDRGPWTAQESKEALNFQIFWTIVTVAVGIILGIITYSIVSSNPVAYLSGGGGIIWLLLLIGVAVLAVNVVLSLLGGLAVQKGQAYRYPILPFRLVK